MKVSVFSATKLDQQYLRGAVQADSKIELIFIEDELNVSTAALAPTCDAVCAFVNDDLSRPVLDKLVERGVRLVLMRCAGFDKVDLPGCKELKISVARVPSYSPDAVAEHGVALLLSLVRKIHKAHLRALQGNFIIDPLVGFNIKGKTIGVLGTGAIGACFARILKGFGTRVLGYDVKPDQKLVDDGTLQYVSIEELLRQSDIVSVHVPLLPDTKHIINAKTLAQMKPSAVLINVSRGALVDTTALIDALKNKRLAGFCADVFEHEAGMFFRDHSNDVLHDDWARLVTMPNVLLTAHQAYLTSEALQQICDTVVRNAQGFLSGNIEERNFLAKF